MTINLEKFAEIVKDTDLDFLDTQYADECLDEDDLREWIQQRIYEQDIIYYHKAMDYLKENDTSLNESFELANDMGYELKNLNSETLATIHYQNSLLETLSDIDLSECFED